jgi:hypothetical protein
VYFEIYKKDKFLTKFESIRSHKFVFFFYSSKYNAISTETSHKYLKHVYVFKE